MLICVVENGLPICNLVCPQSICEALLSQLRARVIESIRRLPFVVDNRLNSISCLLVVLDNFHGKSVSCSNIESKPSERQFLVQHLKHKKPMM